MTIATHPRGDWAHFRRQMPVTANWAYFDNAAVAPLPATARQAIQGWLDQAVEQGDTVWPSWVQGVERARRTAAAMIHADPSEIALVANTTSGISIVAEGFPWSDGDNVVVLANEFPSNQYPWLNLASRGVETRRVPVDGVTVDWNRVTASMDQRTRIVAVSWVGFASGWRLDVNEAVEVAHARGALLLLDAIQGLGVFPLDVQQTPIDFLAADGHKWLLGPEGAGLLYVKQQHLDRLRPIGVGWNSMVQSSDYTRIEMNLRPNAARYEGGSQNMVGMLGLGASLELLAAVGVGPHESAVAERVLEITDLACDQLARLGATIISDRSDQRRSGIVSFEFPGRDPQQLRKQCLARRVVLACRAGRLRISPHAYANEDDVEQLIDALSAPSDS